MRSAGLKFDADGKVAWDEIWGSFCDLAMAGGPPHKGKLLEPASLAEIEAQPERYAEVVAEICRGIRMVTELEASPAPDPGWVRVVCANPGMAGWLVRAITMENVSARRDGPLLDLPAGPAYRLEKEIKNVITVIAKTCHYFVDHMWAGQQRDIAELFEKTEAESPLVQPAPAENEPLRARMAEVIEHATGLRRVTGERPGWLGLECSTVRAAIWMMRALVVSNVLARREETVLLVAVNPAIDPEGAATVQALMRVRRAASLARSPLWPRPA
jgi:hypothetical protein